MVIVKIQEIHRICILNFPHAFGVEVIFLESCDVYRIGIYR